MWVKAAQEQTDGIFYGVAMRRYNHPQQRENSRLRARDVHIADTLEEVAKLAGIDAEQFVKTVSVQHLCRK